MAHNIEYNEITKTHSVFVKGQAPWHGLGQLAEEAQTAEQLVIKANLGYGIEKVPVKFGDNQTFDNRFVVQRTDTKAGLGIVGKDWTPLLNTEAFNFFDALIDRSEAIYESAGVLGKGEKAWILAKMPTYIRVGDGDMINEYVLISNAFTGKHAIEMKLTTVRVVCENTLAMALGEKSLRSVTIPHTKDVLKKVEAAHKAMGMFSQYAKDLED
jgi:phage/plasmid-like protein (TIGR03299 family)